MACLLDFGESGNNFIEIGKKPKLLETMLKLRCLGRISNRGKNNEEAHEKTGLTLRNLFVPRYDARDVIG
jgi:hypothetical protein